MSNTLNSLLFEGRVTNASVLATTPDEGVTALTFDVMGRRERKLDDDLTLTAWVVLPCMATARLAKTCAHDFLVDHPQGRDVRVVGHLEMVNGALLCVAEHVEFKPVVP